MNNIYDSHAHYDSEAFDEDREDLIASLPSKGICGLVNCASDMKTAEKCLELSAKYPFIYAACGVHPHEAAECRSDYLTDLRIMCGNPKCVAIGEIGLDYHYDFSPRDVQLRFFEEQIILANELDMPIIVHDREAHEDTMNLLKKYNPRGVVHCFSGSAETAKEFIKLGMYIGFTGSVTFKNASKILLAVKEVPEDRLLLETDCPYMAPVPFRGKRCDSTLIYATAEKLAELRGVDTQYLIDRMRENGCRVFGIDMEDRK